MRKLCLFAAGLIFIVGSFWAFADTAEKIGSLKKKRAEITLQMHNRRVKLIEEDPKLKELHDKIMALHKDLALRLENDHEMAELSKQAKDIEAQMDKLGEEEKRENK